MHPVMYSHRLKMVLQHTVVELGLTLSINDEMTELSLADNEAMIRETAALLRIQLQFERSDAGTYVTFYK